MANRLISAGALEQARFGDAAHVTSQEQTSMKKIDPATQRCKLYSPDCPAGRIFTGADAIAAAQEDGWVDSPVKLNEATPEPDPAPPAGKAPAAKRRAGGKKAAGDASE